MTEDQSPADDSRFRKVKILCERGEPSAQVLSGRSPNEQMLPVEQSIYSQSKASALALARQIKDGFYRDAAFRQIVKLCMIADDYAEAQQLIPAIKQKAVREQLLRDYPALREIRPN